METIKHFFGLCSDNHSHFDVLDLLMIGSPIPLLIFYYKRLCIGIKLILQDFKNFTKKFWKNK